MAYNKKITLLSLLFPMVLSAGPDKETLPAEKTQPIIQKIAQAVPQSFVDSLTDKKIETCTSMCFSGSLFCCAATVCALSPCAPCTSNTTALAAICSAGACGCYCGKESSDLDSTKSTH